MPHKDKSFPTFQAASLVAITALGLFCLFNFLGLIDPTVSYGGTGRSYLTVFVFFLAHILPVAALILSIFFGATGRARTWFLSGIWLVTAVVLLPMYIVGALNGMFT